MNISAVIIFLVTIAVTLGITFWAASRSKNKADYYAAGGRIKGYQNGLAIAGDFMSATTFLGLTGMYFGTGVDPAAIYFLTPLVGLPLMMLLIAAPLRRAGKFTLGDVMGGRLASPALRMFAGWSTVIISIIYLVGQLVGSGVLISGLFGIDFSIAVITVGILMTFYVAVGGMLAATWVQIIKAVLLVAIIVLLAVLCLVRIPASELYDQAASAHKLGGGLFGAGQSKLDLFSAASLAFGMSIGMLGLPHLLVRFFTVPDAREAKVSVMVATSIIGVVFVLMFAVLGPAAVAILNADPSNFVDGVLKGGPNMTSIHLAKALGGPMLMGLTSAVAFATILAVVSGLVMATASAVSHDIYSVLRGPRIRGDKEEMTAFRVGAALMAVVAVVLAFGFRNENVAFLSALAFAVASSANFPVLILILYWPRLTVPGALAGGVFGLVTSVALITLGPSVWTKILGHPAPIFPSDYPGLLVAPLALVVAVVVSLATSQQQRAVAASVE